MTTTKTTGDSRSLQEVLASARALLEQQEQQARELARLEQEAKALRTRGTREIPRGTTPPPTLEQQLVALLTSTPQDSMSAAAALGVPVGRVKPLVDALHAAGRVHNIGSEVEPLWQHVLGDDCSPADLRALVRRLIMARSTSHRELVAITGARENRISGVLADLREDPTLKIYNLGNGSRGRWFALPADAKPATLRRATGGRR